ncbi:MAG: hypothetical protein JW940_33735 [Polyangiaceae bacterium]|nr:hypothetical protein [Polyangiaceae bacterium]
MTSRSRFSFSFLSPNTLPRSLLACLTACSLLGHAAEARAESGSSSSSSEDSSRAVARTLGEEGLAAFREEDYSLAAEKLGKAFDLVRVPTVGLWLARALARTNQLVQAAERYQQVLQIEDPEGRVSAQRQAQRDASLERRDLVRRIPGLTITVVGAAAEGLTLQLDGAPLDPALLGTDMPVNPGQRTVTATSEGRTLEKQATLAEADHASIELDFTAVEAAASTSEPAPLPEPAAALPPTNPPLFASQGPGDRPVPAERDLGWRRTAGWVGLGVGGAAWATWGVTALLAKRLQRNMDRDCTGSVCLESRQDDVHRYNVLLTASTIGFWTGLVAGATGGYLLLSLPGQSGEDPLVPWIGMGTVGAVGRF